MSNSKILLTAESGFLTDICLQQSVHSDYLLRHAMAICSSFIAASRRSPNIVGYFLLSPIFLLLRCSLQNLGFRIPLLNQSIN